MPRKSAGISARICFAYLLYALLTAGLAIFSYLHPAPTFDRYLYAATVASLCTHDPFEIGREAIRTAPKEAQP